MHMFNSLYKLFVDGVVDIFSPKGAVPVLGLHVMVLGMLPR